jgi:TonB-linked SusC/RagA family outer membrane protein
MRKLLLAFIILFCIPFTLLAQKRTITGNVVDEKGNPAQGVNITVKGNKKEAVQTDKNGNFSLTVVEAGKVPLIISSTEFTPKNITADGSTPLSVKLERNVSTQDEVVVIGYQSVKAKDLTIAVSTLGAKQIKDVPVNSTAEALTGRMAGVQVTTDEGAPGSPYQIVIRGGGSITQDNSPLYIVDGIELPTGLDEIAPQDIESITTLKDASATAIYGARGANGVILVTTKGGRNTKGKVTVAYNGFIGFRELPKEIKVMDPEDFVAYQFESQDFNGSGGATSYQQEYDPQNIGWSKVLSYADSTPVDWQKQVFGRKAMTQSNNVSISGGDDKTQYNLSLTDNSEQGIQITSQYDRKLVNFKFDHIASDKLKFGFNARYNDQVINGPNTSDQGSANANSLRQTLKYHPLSTTLTNSISGPEDVGDGGLFLVNPVLLIHNQTLNRPTTVMNLSGNINYTFNNFISFKSTIGYDVNKAVINSYNDSLTYYSQNEGTPYANLPIAEITTTTVTTLNNSNVFTYSNAKGTGHFKTHNDLTVLVGEETNQNETSVFDIQYIGFPHQTSATSAFNYLQLLGNLTAFYPQQSDVPVNHLSFFSRINLTHSKKYLASFTVRADGSSIFGPQNRWGYFPAASAAWKVSDENFMQKVKFVSDMKLRVSYGEAGNDRITPFSYLPQYSDLAPNAAPNTSAGVGYGFNNIATPGAAPTQLSNPDLKWETTVSKNIGLDVGLFKNRVSFTADVYQNDTRDLLLNITLPPATGYTSYFKNVGSTRNTGVELQLGGTIVQGKDFNYSATFNISFNKNEVTKLSYGFDSAINSGWQANYPDFLVQVGKPLGQIYGLVNEGMYTTNDFNVAPNPAYVPGSTAATTQLPFIYTLKPGETTNNISGGAPMPGSPKYKGLNGDTVISALDETVIGNTKPKFFGGLNQQFSYKGFDMSVFINFQYGNQVLNANKVEYTNGYNQDGNMLAIMENRWKTIDANGNQIETDGQNSLSSTIYGIAPAALTAANKNASIWIPSTSHSYFAPQSFAVEDGSFIRINNITVGYTLPKKVLKNSKIASLRIYGTVNNLAVLTGYSGYDPEVNTRRTSPLTPGVDYSAYPRSRSFIVGLNLSL